MCKDLLTFNNRLLACAISSFTFTTIRIHYVDEMVHYISIFLEQPLQILQLAFPQPSWKRENSEGISTLSSPQVLCQEGHGL